MQPQIPLPVGDSARDHRRRPRPAGRHRPQRFAAQDRGRPRPAIGPPSAGLFSSAPPAAIGLVAISPGPHGEGSPSRVRGPSGCRCGPERWSARRAGRGCTQRPQHSGDGNERGQYSENDAAQTDHYVSTVTDDTEADTDQVARWFQHITTDGNGLLTRHRGAGSSCSAFRSQPSRSAAPS
jgi:hypothetical protein